MKIQVLSDLHFEFHRRDGLPVEFEHVGADVIVLAGDIDVGGNVPTTLRALAQLALGTPIVYVPGNHDYWGVALDYFDDMQIEGVHVLVNDSVTIDGQRFVGSPLFYAESFQARKQAPFWIDFSRIVDGHQLFMFGTECANYLRDTVQADDVVVTHTLPAAPSIAPRWVGSDINCFFLHDMGDLIAAKQPKLWIHGHTHDSCDYRLDNTRVICNPRGYVNREVNPVWHSDCIVTLT